MQNSFLGTCRSWGLQALPADERTLLRYVAFLKLGKNLAGATIKVHLSAIRHLHLFNGFQDPLLFRPRLALLRQAMNKQGSGPDKRRPVTVEMLREWVARVKSYPSFDNILFLAGALIAFFGLLRISEFAAPEKGDGKRGLRLQDIKFRGRWVELAIWDSKTDTTREGLSVVLARRDDLLCPVTWLANFIVLRPRGAKSGQLFVRGDGRPMTRGWFRDRLKRECAGTGVTGNVNTHSLRIGGASAAAAAGLADVEIQRLGRWKSGAFLRYIRPSPANQAHLNLKIFPILSP